MKFRAHELLESLTFAREGRTYRADIVIDDTQREPWNNDSGGKGLVTEWTTRVKKPGERVLCKDQHPSSCRFYDFAAAVKRAREQRWDTAPYGQGTLGQRAERAAEQHFKRMRDWCRDEWCYVGVAVTLLTADGEDSDEWESLWGIESDSPDYHREVAGELADEIAYRLEKEAREAAFWAARDLVTSPA